MKVILLQDVKSLGNYDDISGDGAGNKDHTRTGK